MRRILPVVLLASCILVPIAPCLAHPDGDYEEQRKIAEFENGESPADFERRRLIYERAEMLEKQRLAAMKESDPVRYWREQLPGIFFGLLPVALLIFVIIGLPPSRRD